MPIVSCSAKSPGSLSVGKMRMRPSSSRYFATSIRGGDASIEVPQHHRPTPSPEQANIYLIPPDLHPTHRKLPLLAQMVTLLFSIILSAVTTWRKQLVEFLTPMISVSSRWVTFRKLVMFLLKAVLAAGFTSTLWQEIFLPVSRLSVSDLLDTYSLPSSRSRYESVQLPSSDLQLGVHLVQYENPKVLEQNRSYSFDALYLNHGFGASSLSWLPALEPMVDRLNAEIGIGHDAVGLGFSDRPNPNVNESNLFYYSNRGSAQIGNELLRKKTSLFDRPKDENDHKEKAVALVGHSMGSFATLRMALALPPETKKWIVLVAPALGLSRNNVKQRGVALETTFRSKIRKGTGKFFVRTSEPVLTFGLRRLVGGKNFWRRGLKLAWGDPDSVLDSDVLRFQWPSIGKGWESGILAFTRAQVSVPSEETDAELLKKVLSLENTKVQVIIGSNDPVIRPSNLRKFLQDFPNVPIVEMEGLGHDPWEEDTDAFLEVLNTLIEEAK